MFTKFKHIRPTNQITLQFKYTSSKSHYRCSYFCCFISPLDTHSERSLGQKHFFAIASQINFIHVEYN